MNELQLHARLNELAADLAPDSDPYAQIAGARALHRQQRRTRIGIAGAAVAVALVAVGVPTAVGTLSAPERGDVAGPSPSSDPLRGPASAVRSALAWWEADGTVPDPELGRRPCSDAAEVLTVDSRYEIEPSLQPRGSTTTACIWSTDGSGNTPAEERVDLTLSVAPDLDAAELMARLDVDPECPSTILFTDRSPNVLTVCESDGQRLWELVILDEDSTGGWAMTAAVGDELDAGFDVGARSVAALWGLISQLAAPEEAPQPGDEPEITPMNRVFNELVGELTSRPDLVLESGNDWGCPGATTELERALGVGLTEGPVRASLPPQPVCWWTVGPTPTSEAEGAATLTLAIGYTPGTETALPEEALEPGAQWAGGSATTGTDDTCLAAEVTDEASSATVEACSRGERTRFSVIVPDRAGNAMWTLTLGVPPDADVDPSAAVIALVDVADRLW